MYLNFYRSKLTNLGGEKCLIIQLILHPGHQVVNVLGCRAFDRLLNIGAISPVILISTEEAQTIGTSRIIDLIHLFKAHWHEHERSNTSMQSLRLTVRTWNHYLVVEKLNKGPVWEMQKCLQSYSWWRLCQQEVNPGLFLLITDWNRQSWQERG